uniref:Secreted protein n=1 Tax=Caenorhabditis tropicalis TaxID=1561998 RepID=A0A1I7T690_9PELO
MFPTLRAHFGFSMFLFLATCCAALATILHTQMLETAGLAVDEIVARLGGEPTLTRSNTSVGWIGYGSLWEKEPEPMMSRRNTLYAIKEQLVI